MPARLARSLVLLAGVLTLAGCIIAVPPSGEPVPAPAPVPEPVSYPARPPAHQASIEVQFFYEAMDPYGDWIWEAPHGWVWAPAAVDPFWRPYTVGQWAWSDHGWTWVSDEPWGWAAYHYGRWARVPRHGWIWVPGTVWGPAWVAWRDGPGVIGWAPLPPQVGYRVGVGLDLGHVNLDVVIRSDWWCFVNDVHIVEPRVYRHAYPVGRNVSVIRHTRHHVRIEERDGRVCNHGLGHDRVERAVRKPVPRYRVVDGDRGEGRDEIRRNEMHVWRPSVRSSHGREAAPPRGFGRPQAEPPRQNKAEAAPRQEPPPLPKADPAVERRIEKNWSRDWQRLREMQRKDTRKAGTPAQSPGRQQQQQQQDKTSVQREADENASAAENAYQEQQAERARSQREAEKPRPAPERPAKGKAAGKKNKNAGKDADKEENKEESKGKNDKND